MTNEERMLATGLMDLCGWHVGMVDGDGHVFSKAEDASDRTRDAGFHSNTLPALDSPANWGCWLAWLGRQIDERPSLIGLRGIPVNTKAPRTMMLRYVEWRMGWAEPNLPPSVLAWWKEHGQ